MHTRTRTRAQNLRDLVYSTEGEAVAAKLISVLVTQQLDNAAAMGGGGGALARGGGGCSICLGCAAPWLCCLGGGGAALTRGGRGCCTP